MHPGQPHPPAASPLGFLSDIHGNLAALDAVLEDLQRLDVRHVFVAGDLLFGGSEPLEVWRRLQDVGAKCIRGVSDTALATVDPQNLSPGNDHERVMADRFLKTRNCLGDLIIEQIKRLPETLRLPLIDGNEIIMVHGSPADVTVEISHDLTDDEVMALLRDDPADYVICGATHVPFDRVVQDVHVINVGSVGSSPEGRVAHYTILTPRMEGSTIEQRWVDY